MEYENWTFITNEDLRAYWLSIQRKNLGDYCQKGKLGHTTGT